MVWQKNHDNHDLDERLHRLREDPFDLSPAHVRVSVDYVVALEAKLLRTSMILYASRQLTDGWITPEVLPMIAANAQVAPDRIGEQLRRLERQGLLVRRTKRAGGGWDIRNFLKYNPTKQQVEARRESDKRLAWLQDTAAGRRVRDMIKARDQNRCRYCYIEMTAGDQRSPLRPTYDHVRPHDPDLAKDPRWIVQACAFHNGLKRDRTPEEAGLELLPPWPESDAALRARAEELQHAALIIAATLGEQEPDIETLRAAYLEVLNPSSQPTSQRPDQKATQRPSNHNRNAGSGRVGSGQDGTGLAGSGRGRGGSGGALESSGVGPFDDADPSSSTRLDGE